MSIPHPLELMIVTPDGGQYYLQSSDDSVPSDLLARDFANLDALRLDVDTAMGIQYMDGTPTKRRIFQKAGEYTIVLAENLETEPENTVSYTQQVTYKAAEEGVP